MAASLVIVESPAKAKTIEKFLGKNFKVQASMGHVRDLPKSQFAVDIENGFKPKYITIRGKGEVLQKLRREAKKADEVLLATDPDREGEAISWHLAYALKLDEEDSVRIVFREITREAVSGALEEPRGIDRDLVDAQQARRILDRIVGYKLSPLLWEKVRKGLSAGRVQSVAVRLVYDREKEIEAFTPEEYWTIEGNFSAVDSKQEFQARYVGREPGGKRKRVGKDKIESLWQKLQDEDYEVAGIEKRDRRRYPNPPFTTSSLQQTASRALGYSVQKTMAVAQQLYEGLSVQDEGTVGLITYIRTDSTRVSSEAVGQAGAYVKERFADGFFQARSRNRNQGESQDAHEAIRPTSVFRTPQKLKGDLKKDQYRLYELIWKQFVASQMSPAVYKRVSVDLASERNHYFRASGSELKFPGFLALTGTKREDDPLPPLKEGQPVSVIGLERNQHFTRPPSRYNEASLVKTLEEEGVGRPSTYAPILETIQQRHYVIRVGNAFKPTDLGIIVTELLLENFPEIVDVEFTARLEDELDKIEEGRRSWQEVLDEFYRPFEKNLRQAEEGIDEVELPVKETDEKCEKCGRNLVVKYGRYGKFLACPGFPDCRNTKPYAVKVDVKCPECGGEMMEKHTRGGYLLYGCSNYPDCRYRTWNKPLPYQCPECGAFLVKRRGLYVCSDKSCEYRSLELPADAQRKSQEERATDDAQVASRASSDDDND